jgi:nucleotide-binding universal stress UspA family protein
MNILLAVDGSPFTQKMLVYLTTHPELFGQHNQFTCLTAIADLPPRARAAVGAEIAQGYCDDEAEKVLTPTLAFLAQHGITPQTLHKTGHAGELIAQTAQEGGFDLVVMGSHGHSALANLVMGSVATQVLAHCTVPVLLVR